MTALKPLRPHQQRAIDGEEWRPVVGYEGLYEVSSQGRVLSCARTLWQVNRWGALAPRQWPAQHLRLTTDRGRHAYGRLQVKLCGHGKQTTRLVHQLVAEAFLGPRLVGCEVAHADGNPANNRLGNLRYATPGENTADKARHGTLLRGAMIANAKLTSDQVLSIRAERRKKPIRDTANRFGISIAQVSRIQSGKRWGHVHG